MAPVDQHAKPRPPERQLLEALMRAAKHVFESNLVRRTSLLHALPAERIEEEMRDEITISLLQFSGDRDGGIALVTPNVLNHIVALEILGFDESQLAFGAGEAVYRDAAGEVVNMIAGSFKGILSRTNLQCRLHPPVALRDIKALEKVIVEADQSINLLFNLEEFKVMISLWNQSIEPRS